MALTKKSTAKKGTTIKKNTVSNTIKKSTVTVKKSKITLKTIEKYLEQINAKYEKIDSSLWKVEYDNIPNIIINFDPPILVVRLKLMEISDATDIAKLSRRLLELNSEQMISGAFALENQNVILVEVLQTENLDLNEFQAAFEGITLTAVQNYKELSSL